jgi:hypothetical protein
MNTPKQKPQAVKPSVVPPADADDKPPTHCCDCGAPLTQEEVASDRDLCFECYCFHQE